MTPLVDNTLKESNEKRKDRTLGCDFVQTGCSKMDNRFWKSINYDVRKSSASIVVQFLRSVVVLEDDLQPCELTSLCASKMTKVLEYLSLDQSDEENMCGLLLLERDAWPIWVSPSSSASINPHGVPVPLCELRKFKSKRFVSFVNSLIMKMGIHKFLVGHKNNGFASQAWLSAEILCTWEWPGGNAQTSFLPALVSCCKSEPSSGGVLNSTFDILLNGALVHGESIGNMWVYFNNSIEDVVEPFVRALVLLLHTLFKEGLLGEEETMAAFRMLTDQLFIGEETNKNCLRIIPFIMSRIILPLRTQIKSGVSGEDALLPLEVLLKGGLERSLSFPPLVLWQSGEDVQDWFQLVISCYPVSEKAEEAKELQRHVSDEERTLLLDLFRKQRQDPGASRSAVVVMEETSKNVNDFISSISSMEKENDTREGLGHSVFISDPSIDNAQNALSAFSLLNALVKANAQEFQDALFHRWKQKTYIQQMQGRESNNASDDFVLVANQETSPEAALTTITDSGTLTRSEWQNLTVLPLRKDWLCKFKSMLLLKLTRENKLLTLELGDKLFFKGGRTNFLH